MEGVVRVRCEAIIYTLWRESTEGIFPGVGKDIDEALERILAGSAIGNLENKIYSAILATLLFCHNLL